ncbi:hypothetical protein OH76DRAFT_805883 [Lentinus brumalis]|uniref:Uncharacterized protein n=1 Tax=Lentinus brumalis TaxID=2498619 RepID=A0A371D2T5_9APHY|nr:hypothetical protein OH76DRAFT_805883 [Polyporus brumalis]
MCAIPGSPAYPDPFYLSRNAVRCAAARVVFPGVRKLGIYVWVSSPYASSLARSFPNLTHLVLRSRWSNARGDIREIGIFDQARVEHRRQWQENRSLWPSLMYVQAEDPVLIYILGFPRPLRHVSAWWATQTPSYIFPTIAADMRPDTLELCLTQQNYGHYGASLSLNLSDPSSDSLSCTSDSRGSIPCLRNLIANFQDFDSLIYPGGATDEAVVSTSLMLYVAINSTFGAEPSCLRIAGASPDSPPAEVHGGASNSTQIDACEALSGR